jgi:hypothetical protein
MSAWYKFRPDGLVFSRPALLSNSTNIQLLVSVFFLDDEQLVITRSICRQRRRYQHAERERERERTRFV